MLNRRSHLGLPSLHWLLDAEQAGITVKAHQSWHVKMGLPALNAAIRLIKSGLIEVVKREQEQISQEKRASVERVWVS